MKTGVLGFFCLVAIARGAAIGDTYQKVIAEKGAPKGQASAGSNLILNYPDATIQLRDNVVVSVRPLAGPASAAPVAAAPAGSRSEQIAALKAEGQKAFERIKVIVNQPVRSVPRTAAMKVTMYNPGWFHDGAITPNFNTVDVRATQDTKYGEHEYISSDLNPGVAFRGNDVEFNPMTKFFYTDLKLPKKKLMVAEMDEINRLYRVLGKVEQQLAALQSP